MIITLIILGAALLVVSRFIPAGRNVCEMCGAMLLVVGVLLLLLSLLGYPAVAW